MDPEQKQNWYFTFGQNHLLKNYCIEIYGTYGEARDTMVQNFGTNWAFQYASAVEAGFIKFDLTMLP